MLSSKEHYSTTGGFVKDFFRRIRRKEYYKIMKFVTICVDNRGAHLYNENDELSIRLLVDAQHDRRDRHGFRIDGVHTVDVLVGAVAVPRASGIGARGREQGDDDLAVVHVDQAARGQGGHHAVLVFKVLRAVEDHLLVGLKPGLRAGVLLLKVFGAVERDLLVGLHGRRLRGL